ERGVESGAGLVRRHAHWRGDPGVSSAVDPARAAREPGGAAHLGRLGPRRSRGAPHAGRAAAAELSSADLAQSPDWHDRLRTADARAAGGAAVRRRLLAGAHADESRRPGATLEHFARPVQPPPLFELRRVRRSLGEGGKDRPYDQGVACLTPTNVSLMDIA